MDNLAEILAQIPDDQLDESIDKIVDELQRTGNAEAINYDFFNFWARPDQVPPKGDWTIWMILSGRGAGKTRTGAEWVRELAQDHPGCHIALAGQTVADVRDVMVKGGTSSIMEISPPWFMPRYIPSLRTLTWPNGSRATTYSGDSPDQLRGTQHHFAWVDELAKFEKPTAFWDQLELTMRLGVHPRTLVTTTPRPLHIIKQLQRDPRTHVTTVSTYANRANLAPGFIERIARRYENTTLGRQELYGEILDDTEGALWTRATLESTRVHRLPNVEIVKVVVGVDPAMTGDEGSNETGIIVGCRTIDNHYYVLEDRSGRYSPESWGRIVSQVAHEYHGSVVAEVNQGGDLVESVIRNADRNLKLVGPSHSRILTVEQVRATRGKRMRAEPVAMLFEQGRAHVVGVMPELEDQLVNYTGLEEEEVASDRLDAMVWCLTKLATFHEIRVL